MLIAFFDRTDYDDLGAYRRFGNIISCTRFNAKQAAEADVIITTFTRPPDINGTIINLAVADKSHLSHLQKARVVTVRPWNTHQVARYTLENIPLTTRKLLVIGRGHIGRLVGRIALQKGLDVFYASHTAIDLPYCDTISLHLPLTSESKYWFDKFIPRLHDVYLINTARRQLVSDKALELGLRYGNLRGGLIDGGKQISGFKVTPHIAWRGERSRILRRKRIEEELKKL